MHVQIAKVGIAIRIGVRGRLSLGLQAMPGKGDDFITPGDDRIGRPKVFLRLLRAFAPPQSRRSRR